MSTSKTFMVAILFSYCHKLFKLFTYLKKQNSGCINNSFGDKKKWDKIAYN